MERVKRGIVGNDVPPEQLAGGRGEEPIPSWIVLGPIEHEHEDEEGSRSYRISTARKTNSETQRERSLCEAIHRAGPHILARDLEPLTDRFHWRRPAGEERKRERDREREREYPVEGERVKRRDKGKEEEKRRNERKEGRKEGSG